MIKISKQNNSLIVEGIDNVFYINNGDNSYPLNSLIVATDNSDMATFRSVATNDVLFSGLIQNIQINGEAVTKDNIIQKFDAVSNSSTGGGGGSTVDAYTKEEADTKFATKSELTNVQTVANDADAKADAATSRVESVETAMDDKQDLLVSGTNIKTINNQSILGEGNLEITGGDVDLTNYYSKTEADGKFATVTEINEQAADISALETAMDGKQPTLVSGTNIKTINGNSILGEGNLVIEGGGIDLSNYYNKTEVDTKLDTKQNTLVSGINIKTINSQSILGEGNIEVSGVSEEQAQEIAKIPTLETDMMGKQDTLVSGTNIKTINGESVLGEGNIEVSGGIKTYEASEMPKNLKDALNQVVYEAYYTLDKTKIIDKSTDVEEFLSNLKTGDYLQVNDHILIQYYGIIRTTYKFAIKTGKEITDIQQYGRLITVQIIGERFYIKNNASGPVLQKNDLKTINGEKIVGSGNLEVTIPDATTATSGAMSAADKTKLDSISNEWTGTQAEYDALTTKEDNIIYYVTE